MLNSKLRFARLKVFLLDEYELQFGLLVLCYSENTHFAEYILGLNIQLPLAIQEDHYILIQSIFLFSYYKVLARD